MKTDVRWMAAAVLISLFLSGVAVGGLGVVLIRDDRGSIGPPGLPDRQGVPSPPFADGRSRPAPPVLASPVMMERMTRELDLSPAQQDSVSAILERRQEAVRELFGDWAPRLRASVDSTANQIRGVLTAEQRERFDRMRTEDRGPFPAPPMTGQ